jgi:DNA-binding NarL/FixJ family response regulator
MDVTIDGSMDGIDTAHKLHADYQLPVIFLTSASDDITISRAVQETPYGYLIKPFKRHDLKAAIQLALHNAGANAAAEYLAKR